jgi:hypothetical protein
VARLFVQTYEADSLAGLQQMVLDSLGRAQEKHAIQDLQISHTHHSYFDETQNTRVHCFSALVVLRVP